VCAWQDITAWKGRRRTRRHNFIRTANTIGLPRYPKQAVNQQFAR
jgi:hypothetical protein